MTAPQPARARATRGLLVRPRQPTRRVVTEGGNDMGVWDQARAAAPHVSPAALVAALCPGLEDHPTERPALVVVAAHPDDETFGLGRLAFAWAAGFGRVTGVLATAGEACVDHVMARPDDIAPRRLAEWRAATGRLGFTAQHAFGLPDSRLTGYEEKLTRSLVTLVSAVVDEGLFSDTSAVVLAAPWRSDPHPDHQVVGRATARVAEELGLGLLEYGVWMTFWTPPSILDRSEQVLVRVTHDDRAETAWTAACQDFTSQIEPMASDVTAVVPPEMLAHHREQLVLVSPPVAAALAGAAPTAAPNRPADGSPA